MKKLCSLLMAALFLCLCACGDFVSLMPGDEIESPLTAEDETEEASFEARPLLTFLGLDAFAESYYSDTPVALGYQPESDESGVRGCLSYVFDRASIIAACDALRAMTVTGRAAETPAPGDEFTLFMRGDTEHSFSFGTLPDGSHALRLSTGAYTIEGGETLWDIAFPAYSGDFDVFDLYFDSAVRAFADDFHENTPVSIGYRLSSGATITSEDPELIEAVFRALDGAAVLVVENAPDQNIDLTQTKDYIFTMADGSSYTFSFAQQCLAVRAAAGFPAVYYWLSDIAPLFELQILSESGAGKFEGGAVADLRDDIRTTADVVNGAVEGLSVAGVFVQYDIGGETGYLTLSGDTAVTFLKTMLGVAVTADTADEPSGDTVSVSVTLSDLTGPLLYFTGDTIQQVVGVNYVCASDDMAALRSAILDLAAEGNNTAEVTDGTTD